MNKQKYQTTGFSYETHNLTAAATTMQFTDDATHKASKEINSNLPGDSSIENCRPNLVKSEALSKSSISHTTEPKLAEIANQMREKRNISIEPMSKAFNTQTHWANSNEQSRQNSTSPPG